MFEAKVYWSDPHFQPRQSSQNAGEENKDATCGMLRDVDSP